MFDTAEAAGLLQLPEASLRGLLLRFCDIQVPVPPMARPGSPFQRAPDSQDLSLAAHERFAPRYHRQDCCVYRSKQCCGWAVVSQQRFYASELLTVSSVKHCWAARQLSAAHRSGRPRRVGPALHFLFALVCCTAILSLSFGTTIFRSSSVPPGRGGRAGQQKVPDGGLEGAAPAGRAAAVRQGGHPPPAVHPRPAQGGRGGVKSERLAVMHSRSCSMVAIPDLLHRPRGSLLALSQNGVTVALSKFLIKI